MTLPYDVTMIIGPGTTLYLRYKPSFQDAQSLNGVSFRIVVL